MIDNPRGNFLNSWFFGVRSNGSILRVLARLSIIAVLLDLGGCSPKSEPRTVEESITSGRISVVCAPEAYGLITREQSAFQSLYPQASIQVHVGSSRQAVSALFGATCDMAAVTRELEPEERRAALQGNLGLEGYRFARDALVIIVNRANGVENLTIEDARRIYQGKAKRWSEMGGAGLPVVPVVRPPEADLAAFFGQQVMAGEPVAARVITEPSDSAVVEYVKREPGAIGFVSLGAPLDEVNVLRISSLQGLPYWKPDLEAVYKGDYPLTRFFNLFVRVARPPLANGFITFVTSYDGQKFVRDSGLVPTAVPVRFVRSSPMLSGHRSRRTFPKP